MSMKKRGEFKLETDLNTSLSSNRGPTLYYF